MIKFITEEEQQQLTFDMVLYDQFFINIHGNLCQKSNEFRYVVIGNYDHKPLCCIHNYVEPKEQITKILPKIIKIDF